MHLFLDFRIYLFLFLALVLFSCSTEKFSQRKYLDGRYKEFAIELAASKNQNQLPSAINIHSRVEFSNKVSTAVDTENKSSQVTIDALISPKNQQGSEVLLEEVLLINMLKTNDLESLYSEIELIKSKSTKDFYWVNFIEILSFALIVIAVGLFFIKSLLWVPVALLAILLYISVRIIDKIEHSK
jgi:hypothetical protein